jgi:protein TonB
MPSVFALPLIEAACNQAGANSMTTAQFEESPIARLILSKERPRPTIVPAVDPSIPIAPADAIALPIAVLTEDAAFVKQIRAALNRPDDYNADVTAIKTQDEAAELAVCGRCPILITDVSLTKASIEELTSRLKAHDPALVLIVSGTRDLGGLFISLQSSGAVDGFLLKPVTAGATQLVIESAIKRYRAFGTGVQQKPELARPRAKTQRSQLTSVTPPIPSETDATIEAHMPARAEKMTIPVTTHAAPKLHRSLQRPSWSLVIATILIVATAVWWTTSRRAPGIDPQQVIAEHLDRAERAQLSGRWTGQRNSAAFHFQTVLALDPQNLAAQRGLDRVAAELSRRTQTAMSAKRLAEAAASLESLRELQPTYAELPLLNSQLRLLRDAVLAEHTAASDAAIAAPQTDSASTPQPAAIRPVKRASIEKAPPRALREQMSSIGSRPNPPAPVAEESNASGTLTVIPKPAEQRTELIPEQLPAPGVTSEASEMATPLVDVPVDAETLSPVLAPTEALNQQASQPPSSAPALLKYVAPIYPSEARARDIEGWVQVGLEVTPAGDVVNAHVEDGQKRQFFSRAALIAVRQWKYAPRSAASSATPTSVRLDFQLSP